MTGKVVIEMKLDEAHFKKMESGEKTIEVRLFDEKRELLKVGDNILFKNAADSKTLLVEIIALYNFKTFKELFSSYLFDKTGMRGLTVVEAVEVMHKYYSNEEEKRFGVLGIEIKKL